MTPKNSSSQRRLMCPAWVCGGLSVVIGLALCWIVTNSKDPLVTGFVGHRMNPWIFLSLLSWFLISTVGIVLSIIVLVQECWDDHCRSAALKAALLALALNVVTNPFLMLRMLP